MPFIKDAKTGLPGYTMPDFEEEEHQGTVAIADAPQPIYSVEGDSPREYAEKAAAQAKYDEIAKAQDQSHDPSKAQDRSHDPRMHATLQRPDPAIFQREIALRMAQEADKTGTPGEVVERATAYLTFLRGGSDGGSE